MATRADDIVGEPLWHVPKGEAVAWLDTQLDRMMDSTHRHESESPPPVIGAPPQWYPLSSIAVGWSGGVPRRSGGIRVAD